MNRSPTVLVIGGGATGVGVARDLAVRGVDVTLAEAGGLGTGTSGRSHSLLHSGARYAEADPAGARECIEENEVLRSVAGDCIADTSGLFVGLAGDDPAYFAEKREACEAVGIETETLDPAAARELAPDLAPTVERAMCVPDAVVYPSRLIAATAADAEAHGASVHTHTPVTDLTVADGRVTAATLGGAVDGRVEPTQVVNAAGAWADEVAGLAGLTVPLSPTRGVMVAVEYDRPHPVVNRCRPPADGDILVPHPTQTVLGTTSVPVSDPDEYERADWEIERTVAECAAMLPPVAEREVVRTWWGVRPLYEPDDDGEGRGISRGFGLLESDRAANLTSIVGGKLTTHRLMAEAAADAVCERLGVTAACRTATERLPGADDPARLDAFVARYDAGNPTDSDVIATPAGDSND